MLMQLNEKSVKNTGFTRFKYQHGEIKEDG